MKALVQRVKEAKVEVNGQTVGEITQGILLLLGVEKQDSEEIADKLLEKVCNYRIFSDEDDKMNLSLKDIEGELLIVSQFTLVANTQKGLRPSFSSGADPVSGKKLYDYFVNQASLKLPGKIQTGQFAANMQVSLQNDGPVTFNLEV
ncbi:MAG: D-aminoacyl-tRNA deacylase [Gammaproteobacteria bacterium]|jgi:D-tyrosyl-tRNA(Tyr) deacylase|nr:D-tyrosyl-tRNA(Tyr) deacylase [Xanthomonadales bacterium]